MVYYFNFLVTFPSDHDLSGQLEYPPEFNLAKFKHKNYIEVANSSVLVLQSYITPGIPKYKHPSIFPVSDDGLMADTCLTVNLIFFNTDITSLYELNFYKIEI